MDSENIVTQLNQSLDAMHEAEDLAENIIINTCGFIDKAKEESVNTILEYAELKRQNKISNLVVTGCLSERYKDDLRLEIPEVDAFFGTTDLPDLLHHYNVEYKHELLGERQSTTPSHFAYLKISEGCNRTCSFCAIPLMRGKHISKPIDDLTREASALATNGVRELILIAQELTYYGLDLYKRRALGELLTALSQVDGIEWIRLHYAYPSKFPLDVLDVIASNQKVCNYIDLPLQHGANSVLNRMKRQITRQETEKLLDEIRRRIPNVAIRTTMMVGFPGETEDEFEEMMDFVKAQRFHRMGAFTYSHEEDTSAHKMEDNVDAKIKMDRFNRLMEVQREISLERNIAMIGRAYKVIIDRKEGDYFVGRTEFDSPEVDNEVLIDAKDNYCRIGDFYDVEIINAEEYDLYGQLIIDN